MCALKFASPAKCLNRQGLAALTYRFGDWLLLREDQIPVGNPSLTLASNLRDDAEVLPGAPDLPHGRLDDDKREKDKQQEGKPDASKEYLHLPTSRAACVAGPTAPGPSISV